MSLGKTGFDLDAWQDGGLTDFSQSCFVDYWEELPTVKEICSTFDPYNWKHRMALGKHVIENTGSQELWGPKRSGHFHWAYLAQLDWMRRSGRLASPVAKVKRRTLEKEEIATDSWFGYINLNLTVALYCGAARAGLVPQVAFIGDCGLGLQSEPGFQTCIDIWHKFWISHEQFVDTIFAGKANKNQTVAQFYEEFWSSHTLVIKSSLPRARKLEQFMPDQERKFGLGWFVMVELFSAMSFNLLSLDSIMDIGIGYLPTRVLNEDSMKWLLENRPNEHNVAIRMMSLQRASPQKLAIMCSFFERLSRWENERLILPRTIRVLSTPAKQNEHISTGLSKALTVARMTIKVLSPQSTFEILVLLLAFAGVFISSYPLIGNYVHTLLFVMVMLTLAKEYILFVSNL